MNREEAYKMIGGARQETCEAVMAYNAVLEITKNVFGESNMTQDTIIAAIEAGSYMAWRSIMGPKEQDKPQPLRAGRRL